MKKSGQSQEISTSIIRYGNLTQMWARLIGTRKYFKQPLLLIPPPCGEGGERLLSRAGWGDARSPHPAARFRSQRPSPQGGGIRDDQSSAGPIVGGAGAPVSSFLPQNTKGSGAPRRRTKQTALARRGTSLAPQTSLRSLRNSPARLVSPLGAPPRHFSPPGPRFLDSELFAPAKSSRLPAERP
ncbi:MAG: hypothetical protein QOD40_767 [Alphaproteobacteria bacterium]|nr:hypothetical protein [Alphaproteobacteria bacterium]